MNGEFSRRQFVAGAMAASYAVLQPGAVLGQSVPQAGRTLDIHVHLFGKGDNGSNCRLLQGTAEGPLFEYLSGKLRLRERAKTIDEAYVLALAEQVQQCQLDKVVVLAQDAIYADGGRADWGKTPFYVPNDYLFEVVSRDPQWMIPFWVASGGCATFCGSWRITKRGSGSSMGAIFRFPQFRSPLPKPLD